MFPCICSKKYVPIFPILMYVTWDVLIIFPCQFSLYPLVILYSYFKWHLQWIYPLKMDEHGDFPSLCKRLPEGKSHQIPLKHHFPMVFLVFSPFLDGFFMFFLYLQRSLWQNAAGARLQVARQLSVRFEGVRQLFEKESSTMLLGDRWRLWDLVVIPWDYMTICVYIYIYVYIYINIV